MNTTNGRDDDAKNEKQTEMQKLIGMKLLEQRKIFLWGAVDDDSAKEIVEKLMYLDANKPGEKITFFISSPGGSVTSGYAILDTMKNIASPVATVCMGVAASMASIILSAGKKGERSMYALGEVMIHQPSTGLLQGYTTDLAIHAKQILKTKTITAEILARNCGQPLEQVLKDIERDYWMDAKESIQYGIVDKVYEGK